MKKIFAISLIFVFLLLLAGCATSTPLMQAAKNGDINIVKNQIDKGADVNETIDGMTALTRATALGHRDAARLLIDKGANIDLALGGCQRFKEPFRTRCMKSLSEFKAERDQLQPSKLAVASSREVSQIIKSDVDELPVIKTTSNKNAYAPAIALPEVSPKSVSFVTEKKNKPDIKTVDNYIAVFDFEVTTGDKGISRPLTDSVIHVFSQSDKYEVIDRGNMNKILGEQKFQMSGCVAQECKVEAGQILGVGKIVSGSIGMVGKVYYLTLQLIDVKTGKVELSSEDECRCELEELLGSTRRLAKKLLGEKVEQPVAIVQKPATIAIVPPAAPTKETARDGRFIAYDNGTVIDTKTNLMWAAKDNGSDINWANAKSYCENYRGGGFSDWRMPTPDELAGLYDASKTRQSECRGTFGGTWDIHLTELIHLTCLVPWTSAMRGSEVALFRFDTGNLYWTHPFSKSAPTNPRALPVRSGK